MTLIEMDRSRLLDGKVAVVVGGGQASGATIGNGRATAILFGRQHADVVVADRNLEAAESTAEAIRSEGGAARAIEMDVTNTGMVREKLMEVINHYGRVDVLHNNVGVSLEGGDATIRDVSSDAFNRVMQINLTGMVATCQAVLPSMAAQGTGAIVNIGSVASEIDYPYIAYKTSKAGVVALTENVAIRYAPYGVRANAILPGLIDTPMAIERRVAASTKSREAIRGQRNQGVPLNRQMGTAWDVAEAALFLASDTSGFVTGVSMPVDGGQRLLSGSTAYDI